MMLREARYQGERALMSQRWRAIRHVSAATHPIGGSRAPTSGAKIDGIWRPPSRTLASVETRATFRLFGDAGLTAAAVTRRLGIQPSRALEAGDRAGRRSNATRDSSAWLLSSSPGIEAGTELAEQLHRLLAVLEPMTAALPSLSNWCET